jgi:hypothetical protein
MIGWKIFETSSKLMSLGTLMAFGLKLHTQAHTFVQSFGDSSDCHHQDLELYNIY